MAKLENQNLRDTEKLIAKVLHDINNPLGTLMGAVSYMKDQQDPSDEVGLLMFTSMDTAIAKIQAICRDGLTLAEAKATTFSVGEATRKALSDFLASDSKLAAVAVFSCEVQDDFEVLASEVRYQRTITNFLNNATKAVVRASAGAKSPCVKLTIANRTIIIEDSGCGMTQDQLKNLWSEFNSTSAEAGHGLGTCVIHDFVVGDMGWAIDVNSVVGAGTRFTIRTKEPERNASGASFWKRLLNL